MKNSKLAFCYMILSAFYLTGWPAHGLFSTGGEPPRERPSVLLREEDPGAQDWTPLFSRKELLPMSPGVQEVLEGIKRGQPEDFEKAVRTAYHLMEAYGHNENHDIAIQVSDVKTIYTPEVLNLQFSSLVSLGLPEHIRIHGITREDITTNGHKTKKTTRLGYRMTWEPATPDPELKLWKKRNVREFVEIAQADLPALALLRAVTTYRISVTLEGKHREYRAAFLWMGAAAAPFISTFECLDKIVDQVSLALAEQVPPEGKREGDLMDLAPETGASAVKLIGPQCNVYTEYPYTPVWEHHGSERHRPGFLHQSLADIDASCSCGTACQSVCNPSVGSNLCYDQGGTTSGYHVSATHQRLTSATVQNALNVQNGASCQGTTLCAFTQCASSNCTFSVSLGPSGPAFTSSPTTAMVFWLFEPTSLASCRGCTEYEGPIGLPEVPEENCPVLIALDEGRVEMTDLAGGVRFDVNRDGVAEHDSWPAATSSWSFVALDRNRNGRIDDGGELFGNYTEQRLDATPRNGFAALTVYDELANGGNDDGALNSGDTIYSSLLLWSDSNHDGVSQPAELTPLARRVEEIGLDYRESRARDRYGNEFRYRGRVRLAGGRRSQSVDVFLLHD
jgi:hypothetical protein